MNIKQLKKEASDKLATVVSGTDYPNLLRKLIVQGLIKIEEPVVQLQVKAEDKATVAKLVGS